MKNNRLTTAAFHFVRLRTLTFQLFLSFFLSVLVYFILLFCSSSVRLHLDRCRLVLLCSGSPLLDSCFYLCCFDGVHACMCVCSVREDDIQNLTFCLRHFTALHVYGFIYASIQLTKKKEYNNATDNARRKYIFNHGFGFTWQMCR